MSRATSEFRTVVAMSAAFSLAAVLMAACSGSDDGSEAAVTVFEGARLIVGDGSAPIDDAVLTIAGMTVLPLRSTRVAPPGIRTSPLRPARVKRSFSTTNTAS